MLITTTYTNELRQNSTATDIAWPGTLQAVFNNCSGSHIGSIFRSGDIYSHSSALRGEFSRRRFWYDDGEFGRAVLLGMQKSFVFLLICLVVAIMCGGHAKWRQIVLAQGVCVGIGSGMVYVPSLAMVSISFVKHRALALATVTSGAAIGEWSLVLSYIYIYMH